MDMQATVDLCAESVGSPRPHASAHCAHCVRVGVCTSFKYLCREPHSLPGRLGNLFLRAESLAAPASYHDETRSMTPLPGLLPRPSCSPMSAGEVLASPTQRRRSGMGPLGL